MKTIINALEGKKTYIIATATILYCILGIGLHFMTIPVAVSFIGTTGAIAGLRLGVAKAQDILEVILEILKLIGQATPVETPAQPVVAPEPAPAVPVTAEVPPAATGTTAI